MEPAQAKEYLRIGVAAIDEVTRDNKSGSTFTGVIVTKDGDLVTAHLGDSPASAIIIDKDGQLREVVPLLVEHKPGDGPGTSPSGREFHDDGSYRRIEDSDRGKVLGVAMTHALGDAAFGDVLLHTPELQAHQIQKRLREGDRLFLLATSDGAHNVGRGITHYVHAEIIAERLRQNASLAEISNEIATASAPIRDNVTVALLEVERGKGAIVAVFDGHGGSETSDQAERVLRALTERFDRKDSSETIEEVAA
jgi:serine/threonine protein phosphatase PrpC